MTKRRLDVYHKLPITVTDFVEKLSYTQYIEGTDYELIRKLLEFKPPGKKGKKGKKRKEEMKDF